MQWAVVAPPLIPYLEAEAGKLCEFKARLFYLESSRLARPTYAILFHKHNNKKIQPTKRVNFLTASIFKIFVVLNIEYLLSSLYIWKCLHLSLVSLSPKSLQSQINVTSVCAVVHMMFTESVMVLLY